MFSFLGRLIGKISLGEIARSIRVNLNPVDKKDGLYIHLLITVYSRALVDEYFLILLEDSDQDRPDKKALDLYFDAKQDQRLKQIQAEANERLTERLKAKKLTSIGE